MRTILAWLLYGIGHLGYLMFERYGADEIGELNAIQRAFWAMYQKPMAWSIRIQGDHSGPWEA